MKTKFTPIIALDYYDGTIRNTCFQLCAPEKGRLCGMAVVTFTGDEMETVAVKALQPRLRAIIRLARIYRSRSFAQVFFPL